MENMNEWDSIKQTILDIKKKREETRRKRNQGIDIEKMLTEELSKSLSMEIDKAIFSDLMKKMK
jgi:hypothetical protein